jgi:hypothetical protein
MGDDIRAPGENQGAFLILEGLCGRWTNYPTASIPADQSVSSTPTMAGAIDPGSADSHPRDVRRGRPRSRRLEARPRASAVPRTQPSVPSGRPRRIASRTAAHFETVFASRTQRLFSAPFAAVGSSSELL